MRNALSPQNYISKNSQSGGIVFVFVGIGFMDDTDPSSDNDGKFRALWRVAFRLYTR